LSARDRLIFSHGFDEEFKPDMKRIMNMRKVVAGLFISLDGVTESPDKWQFDHFDEDMMVSMGAHIAAEDTILLGRVTCQEWAPYLQLRVQFREPWLAIHKLLVQIGP